MKKNPGLRSAVSDITKGAYRLQTQIGRKHCWSEYCILNILQWCLSQSYNGVLEKLENILKLFILKFCIGKYFLSTSEMCYGKQQISSPCTVDHH